jgi:hypothetical protein
MNRYRVSLSFTNLPDADLDEFVSNIIVSLTGNTSFPTPPVSMLGLAAGQTAFHNALIAAGNGGKLLTGAKNEKRAVLEEMLRLNATYVQGLASQNVLMLQSSGFDANSTNRASVQLDAPAVLNLDNGMPSELVLRMQPVVNAKSYEVQTKNGGGWTPAGIFTQAREITLSGLTPGQVYSVQSRAIGGSKGFSNWCYPVSHMVM